MDLRVATGQEFAGFVGNVDFRKKCARSRINRFRGANKFALEFAARELRQLKVSRKAGMDRRRRALRNIYIDANGIGLREREQELSRATVAGVDQRSDIDIATGDDAAKRRVNMFKRFEFIQTMNVCLCRSDRRLLCGQIS